MTRAIALLGGPFVPTTSLTGSEPQAIYRGYNAVVRGLGSFPYIENYLGSKDLAENYDLTGETLTGTLAWAADDPEITGTTTAFLSQLRPGQWILAGTEAIVVNKVISDTSFIAERAPTSTANTQTAYYLFCMFELDGQRGVLRRGNAITGEQKDIIFVGDGNFFLNGVDTTFNATRQPKRLQRSSAGTYTEFPIGFPDPPPPPVMTFTTGGWKGMQAGSYAFAFSWYNEKTEGFSNPSRLVKQDAAPVDLTIAASGRFTFDATNQIAVKPTNADGVLIWGTLSGGGVAAVNASNFAQGTLFEVRRLPFASKTVTAVDTTAETITIVDHRFKTGDYVVYVRTGGTTDIGGLTSGTRYFVIRINADTFQLASTVNNLKASTPIDLTGAGDGVRTFGHFDSSDVAYIEYLDGEVGSVASGDNDQPPECEWVTEFSSRRFYISCYGNRPDSTSILGSPPGNYVVPGKEANLEAAPARWRVTVDDEITGFAKGVGRLFCLTRTGIPFVTPTGRTELARLLPTPLDMPFTSRPFWTKGSIQPYGLSVIQGDVYLYTGRQPLRSPSNADEKSVPFEIGKLIRDLTKDVPDGHVLTVHDPKNQQVTLILSAVRKNAQGYWVSDIIPLDLTINPAAYQPIILLSSPTEDMIVSGAAIVNNRLEFLAGGRRAVGAPQMRTYRYDERNGSGTIPYAVAFQPSDNGQENKQKKIKSFRYTGRMTNPFVQVHASTPNSQEISPADIESGTNSLTGNIPLESKSDIARHYRVKHVVSKLNLYSVRIGAEWVDTGDNDPDRLDELVIEVQTHGRPQ